MYSKQFEIRWNDLDANQHLGNSSYVEFMSHTRMSLLTDHGLGLEELNSLGLGPIVLFEHIHYFKEITLGQSITVSAEINGVSDDGRFVLITHNLYNNIGKNLAFSEMLFSWIDLYTRKLGRINNAVFDKIMTMPQSSDFKILTKDDIRKHGRRPIDLNN